MKPWNGIDAIRSAMDLSYFKGFYDCFSYFNFQNGQQVLTERVSKTYLTHNSEEMSGISKNKIKPIVVEENALKFLKNHTDLFKLIQTARSKLDEYFPQDFTKYVLRSTDDFRNQNEGLILEIHTAQNFDEAMSYLEKFEDEWWLDKMPTGKERFIIDVVFA